MSPTLLEGEMLYEYNIREMGIYVLDSSVCGAVIDSLQNYQLVLRKISEKSQNVRPRCKSFSKALFLGPFTQTGRKYLLIHHCASITTYSM